MNTSDAFIGKNANAHLPKYIASRPKKICRSSKTKLSTIQKKYYISIYSINLKL